MTGEAEELPPRAVAEYLRRLWRNRAAYAEADRLRSVPLDQHEPLTCPCLACHLARVTCPDPAIAALEATWDGAGTSTPPDSCTRPTAQGTDPERRATAPPTDTTSPMKDDPEETVMPLLKKRRPATASTADPDRRLPCSFCGVSVVSSPGFLGD